MTDTTDTLPASLAITVAWNEYLAADAAWQANPSDDHLAAREAAHRAWQSLFLVAA